MIRLIHHMGLTIHYNFAYDGEKQVLEDKLENLKNKFTKLPVRKVHDIVKVDRCLQEYGYGKYSDERFYQNELGFGLQHVFAPLRQKRTKLQKLIEKTGGTLNLHRLSSKEYRIYKKLEDEVSRADRQLQLRILQSGNGYILPVDVGEGCEEFEILIGRLGNSRKWRGGSFTKTQYAQDFVKSHLSVISMLDVCNNTGILHSVRDEGNYWETRDLKVLSEEINSSTALLKEFVGVLKEVVPEPLEVKSNIDTCENYLSVERDEIYSDKKK